MNWRNLWKFWLSYLIPRIGDFVNFFLLIWMEHFHFTILGTYPRLWWPFEKYGVWARQFFSYFGRFGFLPLLFPVNFHFTEKTIEYLQSPIQINLCSTLYNTVWPYHIFHFFSGSQDVHGCGSHIRYLLVTLPCLLYLYLS